MSVTRGVRSTRRWRSVTNAARRSAPSIWTKTCWLAERADSPVPAAPRLCYKPRSLAASSRPSVSDSQSLTELKRQGSAPTRPSRETLIGVLRADQRGGDSPTGPGSSRAAPAVPAHHNPVCRGLPWGDRPGGFSMNVPATLRSTAGTQRTGRLRLTANTCSPRVAIGNYSPDKARS